ncbi:hypothetical protein Tco_0974534 [Tanacetum coccineum]|uniref:Uncharacterized protein n=1 Tax=Tanacetum coccineum TaxID=301880 RepID=A0ABQ5EC00_9ASTR
MFPAATGHRPTASQPPSSPANIPATTTSLPPENFSGGVFRPTPKMLPINGSTRSPITHAATRLNSPPAHRHATATPPPSLSSS